MLIAGLLAGCSSPAAAPGTTSEQPTQLPDGAAALPSRFISTDVSPSLTTTGTINPENGDVIVPAGTLSITEVRTVDSIDPAVLGEDAPETGTAEDPVTTLVAAPNEKLYVLTLSYAAQEHNGSSEVPQAELSVSIDGVQKHAYSLANMPERYLLVSAPNGGETQLVVSSDGHDQLVDVTTGERQADNIAAAYYLPNPRQEPAHSLTVKPSTFKTANDETVTADLESNINAVELTAWNPEDGWAKPDTAWLAVDWDYEFTVKSTSFWGASLKTGKMSLGVDLGEKQLSDDLVADSDSYGSESVASYVSVPVTTEAVTLDLHGSVAVSPSNDDKVIGKNPVSFTSDKLKVEFPS